MRKLAVLWCLLAATTLRADSTDAKNPAPSSPGVDLSSLRDITGIEQLPPAPESPRWPYAVAAGLILLAGLGLVGWKLRKRPLRQPPPPPPEAWARQELDRIEALRLPEVGKVDRFHTLVADTVRTYVQMQFDVQAPRQTTVEFLAALKNGSRLPGPARARLAELLQHCDLVKFARAECGPEACQAVLESARQLVLETYKKEDAARS